MLTSPSEEGSKPLQMLGILGHWCETILCISDAQTGFYKDMSSEVQKDLEYQNVGDVYFEEPMPLKMKCTQSVGLCYNIRHKITDS